MEKLGFSEEDSFQQTKLCDQKQFLCDSDWPREDMVDMQGGYRLLICTDVPPHIHKRVTTVTGSPSPGAHLLSLPLGPSALHVALFDSDGSWKPGDIRGCNNINALRQVFKSGTCLIIITTYVLFIVLQRDKSSWCSPGRFRVFLSSLPSSLLPVLLSSPGRGEKSTVWEESEGGGRMVGAAVICKSFIYVWHLHNEAGGQWRPWLAGDRVACLQF